MNALQNAPRICSGRRLVTPCIYNKGFLSQPDTSLLMEARLKQRVSLFSVKEDEYY